MSCNQKKNITVFDNKPYSLYDLTRHIPASEGSILRASWSKSSFVVLLLNHDFKRQRYLQTRIELREVSLL